MYVNVALNIPADKLFTYAVPDNLKTKAMIGKRVYVPFGHRKRTGFITAVTFSCDLEQVKPLTEILDDEPLFDNKDLQFFVWISRYCIYPLGKTLAELVPAGSEKKDYLWVLPRRCLPVWNCPDRRKSFWIFFIPVLRESRLET